MKTTNKLPSFWKDDSESDKLEEVIDFFLSWTLRCAESKYKEVNDQLHIYSKKVLSYFLFGNYEELDYKNIVRVSTEKQWKHIDLWVEIEIENGEKYVLVIEDKYYSIVTNDQLLKYRKIAENYCSVKKKDFKIKFAVVRPDWAKRDGGEDFVEESNHILIDDVEIDIDRQYRYIVIDDIHGYFIENHSETTNDIFNEMWFYWTDGNE